MPQSNIITKSLVDMSAIKSELRSHFEQYVERFYSDDSSNDKNTNFLMKEKHTYLVCNEISAIARSLKLSSQQTSIAEIAALFHDVGRFYQYDHYKTFVDARSENHAELGVKIIHQENFLESLDETSQQIVINAVKFHNRAEIPSNLDKETTMTLKMLRDADKIDIWRVVTNYYSESDKKRNTAIELNLPDTQELSDEVLNDIVNGQLVVTKHLNTLNDFKALQMGWVFDLNFTHSFKMLNERRYLEIIRDTITDTTKAALIYKKTKEYLESKIAQ